MSVSNSTSKGILFVCSGNLCRSPIAEVLARDIFERAGLRQYQFLSAGTLGFEGLPAAENAVRVMEELGFDLTLHLSQGLTDSLLERVDGVVVMSSEHEVEVLRCASSSFLTLYRLWEYTDIPGRLRCIADPMGRSLEHYVTCRDDIRECLINWAREFGS